MFHELRRKDRAITSEEINAILLNCEYGIFATVGCNGYPYGVPVNYVYSDNKIYFHCALNEGHKIENIRNSNKVCFTVVGQTQVIAKDFSTKYESVILFGRAEEITGGEKENALLMLLQKYSKDYIEKGKKYISNDGKIASVVKIEIEHITGKAIR